MVEWLVREGGAKVDHRNKVIFVADYLSVLLYYRC